MKPDECARAVLDGGAAEQPKMASERAASLPQRDDAIRGGHGVVRGHVVAAVGVLRTRLAEQWTLSALADEVHWLTKFTCRALNSCGPSMPRLA